MIVAFLLSLAVDFALDTWGERDESAEKFRLSRRISRELTKIL